jgi:lysozyme family protein
MALFEIAFAMVLEHEGGYVNDPYDPGGETIYGLSRNYHPEAWANGKPSIEQAKMIYKRDYWDSCRCDKLPPPLALMVFDSAINQGPQQAIRFLQRALNVEDDGIIGPKTLKAAQNSNTFIALAVLASQRIKHYSALSTWQRYGNGWSQRVLLTAMTAATYS